MTIRQLTIALATAAALIPVTAPAHAADIADNRPANYGTCMAEFAMFGEDPMRAVTQSSSPLTVFLDDMRTVGPRYPDEISTACKPER